MKLSALQKHILITLYESKGKANKFSVKNFYDSKTDKPKHKDIVSILTKSADRLIAHGLVLGWGTKTSKKWYIKDIKLTAAGRRLAKKFLGEQLRLPLAPSNHRTSSSTRSAGRSTKY